MRRPVRLVAGLLTGLVLAVFSFEVMLRLMASSPWWWLLPAVTAQFDAPDPEVGYAHRPGVEGLWLRESRTYVRINAQGLRDRPREAEPAPGTTRIAVVGDSITEAFQVPEADLFTLGAERILNGRGDKVEVLNFGLSGATPLQQLLFVASRGAPLGIKAVVMLPAVSDFLSSTMSDDRYAPAYVEDAEGHLTIGRAYRERRSHRYADRWQGRLFFWLVDHFRVADMLYLRWILGSATAAKPARAETTGDTCGPYRTYMKQLDALFDKGEPHRLGRRLDRFLADTHKFLDGKPVLIAVRGLGPSAACPGAEDMERQVSGRIKEKFATANVGFVDFDAAVRARVSSEADRHRMFGFGRHIGLGHLNVFGHDIYAKVLAEVIASQVLHAPPQPKSGAPDAKIRKPING